MKILIPTVDYPPIEGGIGTVSLRLSRELAALGHEVCVVAPRVGAESFRTNEFDRREPGAVRRFRGYSLGWARLAPFFAAAWPWARRADLILGINIAYGGLLGRAASRTSDVPYVAFAYAYEFLKFRRVPGFERLLCETYNRARLVVAISRFTRDRLIEFGVHPERIEIIFPGAPDPTPFSPKALDALRYKYVLEDSRVILAVGRFVARKGHMTLVRALPAILEEIPDAVLVLAGRGPLLHDVLNEAYRLGVRQHLLCPGCLSDEEVAGLYQVCDVFALPTGEDARGQVEGFGLVFAEAQSYGKPVVGGRSGGVMDAVLDGETGLLVEPKDPEALAAAIVRVLKDRKLAKRLGENGRRRVESELNWTRFTQRLIEAVEARR